MPETQHVVTPEQREALDIAEQMIAAGIPVFTAPPCPAAHGGSCSRPGHEGGRQEYDLPPKWQLTVPSTVWLERWQPGHALAAVGGHTADFLDVDPRNGGDTSEVTLAHLGHLPRVYGAAETPSGGRHYLIAPIGERKACPVAPDLTGLDYQGGAPDGQGRGFVFIAPTVRRSKVDEQPRAYRWVQPPDLQWLADGGDPSGELLAARIISARTRPEHQHDNRTETREFTETEAQAFCNITLQRLMQAQVGEIEEKANAAAAQLSHFVPDFWSEEFAYSVLMAALGETAYDPGHPASQWTADKFRPVLAGTGDRAPGDWKAVRKPEPAQHLEDVPTPEPDAVEALIAEMLLLSEVATRPAPRPLIDGLLNLDSESWIIGAPGSKKSFVALDMAAHIATGRPWQGRDTTQAPVVMIVAEGAGGMTLRVRAWEKIHGTLPPNVYVLPRPVQAADRKAWAVLVEACRRLAADGFVLIDTQARTSVGLKENDATDMGLYVEAVSAIRQATRACVTPIHHTGRQGGDARGSSALDGAQHSELKVVSTGKLTGQLITDKQKDMEEADPIDLLFEKVDLGLNERGKPISSLVLSADPFATASAVGQTIPDHGQVEVISEPGQWTFRLFDDPRQETKRRILQVLADAGGQVGITESRCMALVAERWHGGKVGRQSGQLRKGNFTRHWSELLTYVIGQGDAAGELLIVQTSGEKRAVNPALETLSSD